MKTFSKTRGTARMNVGWNSAKSSSRLRMSEEWPSRTRAFTAPTSTMRAKTWASGRKSSVAGASLPSDAGSKSSGRSARTTVSSNMKLPWVSMQPLGLPVVPEV